MAAITFRCSSCSQMLQVAADAAGKKVRCSKCNTILTIPAGSEQVQAAPAPVTAPAPPPRPSPPPMPRGGELAPATKPQRDAGFRDDDFDDHAGRSREPRRSGSGSKPFSFDGTAGTFFVTALLAGLLTVFTLGIGFPWAFCMIERWKLEHTRVEGRRLAFHGQGLNLLGNWIVWYLLMVITLGIYTYWMVPAFQRWIADNTDFADA